MGVQGRGARNKGNAGELEIRDICRVAGYPEAQRTPLSGSASEKGDISLVPGLSFEVKRQERPSWAAWLKQAEAQARPDQVPLVVWRKSYAPWWALVKFEPFIAHVGRLEAFRRLLADIAGRAGTDPALRREILGVLRGDAPE